MAAEFISVIEYKMHCVSEMCVSSIALQTAALLRTSLDIPRHKVARMKMSNWGVVALPMAAMRKDIQKKSEVK